MSNSNTDYSKRGIAIASVLEPEKYGQDASQRLFDLFFATSRNEAKAHFLVGCVYAGGEDVPVNLAKAFKWIAKAANQGHAYAQWLLGRMYSRGDGVPRDDVKALTLYRQAADQGLKEAQHSMGVRYINGKGGLTPDPAEAERWFKLAGTIPRSSLAE